MAKTIAVSNEVYELLQKVKMPGESFSDVIKRGLQREARLSDIFGSGTITLQEWGEVKPLLNKAEAKTVKQLRVR